MNLLSATVGEIRYEGGFTFVTVKCGDIAVKMVKTGALSWPEAGDPVECRIPEASVAICRSAGATEISIENRIAGTVVAHRSSACLTEVTLTTAIGPMVALVTRDAFARMALEVGSEIVVLVKAVDVTLWPARMKIAQAS